MLILTLSIILCSQALWVHGEPVQFPLGSRYFDTQGHRGSRGNTIENTLPAFAWALIDGVTTLELDNGITKDGVVVTWHDEQILDSKCQDTVPAFSNDPDFPYVGKYIANLTILQLKTLDCGSKRQTNYPMQLLYPGTKISTLREVFEFASCADPQHEIQWNIESKINILYSNTTRDVMDFVEKQHTEFMQSLYNPSQITYQSFDWRTLIAMKALEPRIPTSALIEFDTAVFPDGRNSPWLGGIRLDDLPGNTLGIRIALAAWSIGADILSPAAISSQSNSSDPSQSGYLSFTTKEMIEKAHELGLLVKPWTVNQLNVAEQLMDWGVDGLITDYPDQMLRWIRQRGLPIGPRYSKRKVLACLDKHLQRTDWD